MEQVFDAAEYVVLPAMITSPVFSTTSLEAGKFSQYAAFARTLIQTKDLLCALFTEVLGVVAPRDAHTLMRIAVDLARVEAEHMARRRMDDTGGYVALRDALAELLMALQAPLRRPRRCPRRAGGGGRRPAADPTTTPTRTTPRSTPTPPA